MNCKDDFETLNLKLGNQHTARQETWWCLVTGWQRASFEDSPVIGSIILSTLLLRWRRRSTEIVRVFYHLLIYFEHIHLQLWNPWRIANEELQPRPLSIQESNAQVAVWAPQPVYVTSVPSVSPSSENCDHSSWVSSPLECSCNSLHSKMLETTIRVFTLEVGVERFPLGTFLEPTTFCPFFCGTNESMVDSLRGTGGSLRCKRRRLAAGSACHCDGFLFKLFSTIAMVPREHYAVPPLMDRAVHITMRKETPVLCM